MLSIWKKYNERRKPKTTNLSDRVKYCIEKDREAVTEFSKAELTDHTKNTADEIEKTN